MLEIGSFYSRCPGPVWRIRIRGIRIISLDPDPYQKLAGSGIRIRIRINAMPIYLNNQILYCTYNMYCIQYSTTMPINPLSFNFTYKFLQQIITWIIE